MTLNKKSITLKIGSKAKLKVMSKSKGSIKWKTNKKIESTPEPLYEYPAPITPEPGIVPTPEPNPIINPKDDFQPGVVRVRLVGNTILQLWDKADKTISYKVTCKIYEYEQIKYCIEQNTLLWVFCSTYMRN